MESTLADISELTSRSTKNNYFLYALVIVVVIAVIFVLRNRKEHMSGGTLQQLTAQDAQDINLNGTVSNNNFVFNQPTKVLQGTMRGAPVLNNNIDGEAVMAYTGDSGIAPFPFITPPRMVRQG
jgi:hypothetical protein